MVKTHTELVKQFIKEHPKETEDLSYDEVAEIIRLAWEYFDNIVQSGIPSKMRFKYLGTFTVYEGRKKHFIKRAEINYKEGNITKEQLEDIKNRLG